MKAGGLGPGTESPALSSASVQEPGIDGRTLLLLGNYLFALSRFAGQGFYLIILIKQEISTSTVRGAGRLWSDSVARYPQCFEFPGRHSSRSRLRDQQQPSRIEVGTPLLPAGLQGHPRGAIPPQLIALRSSPTMSINPLLAFPPNVRCLLAVTGQGHGTFLLGQPVGSRPKVGGQCGVVYRLDGRNVGKTT